ncbi:MAG: hypothetical protein LAP21_09805 [Acidobacteriia bacterium]|nr:hypothetical protein [Terriglobia bacterium]
MMIVIAIMVVVPFAFTPASFPLFFELAAALLSLAAVLAVAADGLVQSFFRLMDFSLALVVAVKCLHGNHGAEQDECA